jgi:hypothetical protein
VEPTIIGQEEAGSEHPEMVARVIYTRNGWREHDRGVLVPNSWADDPVKQR